MTVLQPPMDLNPAYPWDHLYSPSPTSLLPTTGFMVPQSQSDSSSWASTSITGSPSPSVEHAMLPLAPSLPTVSPQIVYNPVVGHLPTLYNSYSSNPTATQILQSILDLIAQGGQPNNSLVNDLILRDGDHYRCSVSTCRRHGRGRGWTRLDRARDHYRTEHLGGHFLCNQIGW